MERHLVAATVLCLVLLAGCNGFGATGNETDRGPYGAENPVERSPEHEAQPPPGLGEETITSARLVADAHAEYLEEHAHTVERDETWTYQNGTVAWEYRFSAAAEAGGPTLADEYASTDFVEFDGSAVETDYWGTEETVFERVDVDGEPVRYDTDSPSDHQFTEYGTVTRGLEAVENVTVTPDRGADATRYTVGSTGPQPHDLALHAVVHEAGYVESYALEYEEERSEERLTVVVELEVDRVGDPELTVEEPEWLPEATDSLEDEGDSSDANE